jgi:Domain of unknown function (DUF1906)
MAFGVDYAWGRPSMTSLKTAGVTFACRYLSHDTTGKNLTLSEARTLAAAGIWVVVVWETTAQRAMSGHGAGVADAQDADAMARACGMPAGRPIYFAVDFDASASDQSAINAYLDGASSVIGKNRVGIYGGVHPVSRALDDNHCEWAWQTYAWSGGALDTRSHIYQYSNDHTIGGVGLDYDRSLKDDYGQWMPGKEPDVALTADDLSKIKSVVWTADDCPAPAGSESTTNPTWMHENVIRETYSRAREASTGVADLKTQVAALAKAIAAIPGAQTDTQAIVTGVLAGLDPAALADTIATKLDASVAAEVLNELKARLES